MDHVFHISDFREAATNYFKKHLLRTFEFKFKL